MSVGLPRAAGRAGLALARRGGRPLRFAGSEVARAAALGTHGLRQARAAEALAPGREVRRRLYRRLWEDAAAAEGAAVVDLGEGVLRLERDGAAATVWDNLVPLDDPVSTALAGSRSRSHALLAAAGVRVPAHAVAAAADRAAAARLLHEVGTVVVKPAAGTGAGAGVTCGVRTGGELDAALAYAARWGGAVAVEEQAVGTEYRLLVLDGAVVATVRREPPVLFGDGRSTVAELVRAENARRRDADGLLGVFPLTLDLDLAATQRRAGRSLRTVVAAGEAFVAKTAVNQGGPAQNAGLAAAPDAVGEVAVRAARALGLRLSGVEVVLPTDGSPPVVLEVNSTPGLHYHYVVAENTVRTPVCRPLLHALLSPSLEAP